MPAFTATALKRRGAIFTAAATRARDSSRRIRAETEQRIIDSECYATKLTLAQDREAWRAYWRKRGQRAGSFVPYLI